MTSLRQRMIEDMQVRNLSKCTQDSYVRQVSLFARHFNKSPELLGPEQIRAYQIYLTNEKKLATSSILVAISALRFLYRVTLKKDWSLKDILPLRRSRRNCPLFLAQRKFFSFCMRQEQETSRDLDHLLRRRSAHLRGRCSHASRDRQQAHGHPCRAGQRAERSLRDALTEAAGDPA